MTYLLFLDESGHDHKVVPYEVRGGVALHSSKLWSFIQAMRSCEESAFGCVLSRYGVEIKGSKLLAKKAFKWLGQRSLFDDEARRKYATNFLERGVRQEKPHAFEFAAYGQACIQFANDIFRLLREHQARIFACMIPRGVRKPDSYEAEQFLRKDHVFLLERFFYFLEAEEEDGLLIFDQSDKTLDREFVRRVTRYFVRSYKGRYRAGRVVPVPVFVSSDMVYAIQAADVIIYAVNWGYRRASWHEPGEARDEIKKRFGPWLSALQFRGRLHKKGGTLRVYGIVRVCDPYRSRKAQEKGGNALRATQGSPSAEPPQE